MSPIKGPSVLAQGYGEAKLGDRMSKSEGDIHKCFQRKLVTVCCLIWGSNLSKVEQKSKGSLPERIYNSHYGNGAPTMFTS